MQSHTPRNSSSHTSTATHTHLLKYLVSLLAHFSLSFAFAHSLFVFIRLISLIEFSLLWRVWLVLRRRSWERGFCLISQKVWGRGKAQRDQTRGCVYFCTGSKPFPSVWIKAKRKCQSFQATHTLSLWSLCLSPHLPCPSYGFIWITPWCTWKCKFKAVLPCPRLIYLIEGESHLAWFPQWGHFSLMHTDNALTWFCFHPFQSICLSGYLKMSWSAQSLLGQRSELFLLIKGAWDF